MLCFVSNERTLKRNPLGDTEPVKPYSTLPYPILPYPTLPYPTLPYPTIPYPTMLYYYHYYYYTDSLYSAVRTIRLKRKALYISNVK